MAVVRIKFFTSVQRVRLLKIFFFGLTSMNRSSGLVFAAVVVASLLAEQGAYAQSSTDPVGYWKQC